MDSDAEDLKVFLPQSICDLDLPPRIAGRLGKPSSQFVDDAF